MKTNLPTEQARLRPHQVPSAFFAGKVTRLHLLLFAVFIAVAFAGTARAELTATFNSAADIGVTAEGYTASGALNVTLGFAPEVGTSLTVVKNTALPFISGMFNGIPQGSTVNLSFDGKTYPFLANYYGGSGNDFVLQWPYTKVKVWGNNDYGQKTIPSGLNGVVAIAASGYTCMALKRDGTVVVWGANTGTRIESASGLRGVVAIAAGYNHSLALKSNGTVVAWGGFNSYKENTIPTGLSGVVAIAAGENHSMALKSDGTVKAWGLNFYKQTDVPSDLSGVVAIEGGNGHSMALKSDGTVKAWGGATDYGEAEVPSDLSGVVGIAAGYRHSLALKADGTVVNWGWNFQFSPKKKPDDLSEVEAITAGETFSMALKSDGTLVAWGDNNDGQADPPLA